MSESVVEASKESSELHWLDCKHKRNVFITGGHASGSGGSEREHVEVCAECGLFRIFADKNGVRFDLNFSLYSNAALIAASQSIVRLNGGPHTEPLSKRVWKPLDFASLRLYMVTLHWCLKDGKQGKEIYIVAADSPNQTPRSAANLIRETYKETYDANPQMSYWDVHGYALNVLQPLEWTENGVTLLNNQLVNAVRRYLAADPAEQVEEWQSAYDEMARLVAEADTEVAPR